jgi:hypothetical protein
MPGAWFKLMIAVFEQAKTFHALDRTVTVISTSNHTRVNLFVQNYVTQVDLFWL